MNAPMTSITLPKSVWKEAHQRFRADSSHRITVDNILEDFDSVNSRDSALNALSHFKSFGLIDENGRLTEIGRQWASDSTYAEACATIINKTFPTGAIAFLEDATLSTMDKVRRLQEYGKFGEAGAKKTVRFFQMLLEDSRQKPLRADKEFSPKTEANEPVVSGAASSMQSEIGISAQNPTERSIHLILESSFPVEKIPPRLKAIYSAIPDAHLEITMKA